MIDGQAIGPAANERYVDYARTIHAAGEHLLALINGLLDLTKIEAGRFALSEAPVILAEAVEEAVSLIGVQARAKSVILSADIAPDLVLHADAQCLRQVLLNLLSNAVKFTPSGGRVEIAAMRGASGDLQVRVSDSGVGIPAEALDRIFVPFERVRHKMAPSAEGTGLGLAIVTLPATRLLAAETQPTPHIAEAAD
jgi:two-component system cell cycle sensor histidine kinase PleC